MNPALTVKSQVTLPKPIRDFLGLSPGQRVRFEPLPDGRVAISAAELTESSAADPLAALRGSATVRQSTDDVMRMTRGADWNQP
ncbi:MAG: AbrB family transcriptional regulator [Betaproteobacteria bacterium]|nr:MAG: AbrB family transcriptional regulator [Betaproteobacteria bacterium]